jgi:hypothetical protein
LHDASLRNAEAQRADENSPLFQQRERVQKTERSPQGTNEIMRIPSSEDQLLLLTCKAIYGRILAVWNKRFSRPLAGTRLMIKSVTRR